MKILFFSNSFTENEFGGMESHRNAFVRYFEHRAELYKISNKKGYCIEYRNKKLLLSSEEEIFGAINELSDSETIFFFNDFRWSNSIEKLKKIFTNNKFVLRSGGNDIFRAPIWNDEIPLSLRQRKIVDLINNNIDCLIINSDYSYLRNIGVGINPRIMVKIRGGVDCDFAQKLYKDRKLNRATFDKKHCTQNKKILALVSRFVPFKGIIQFLDEIRSEIENKSYFLLIVGDGELFDLIKNKLENEFKKESYLLVKSAPHNVAMEYISISDVFVNCSMEFSRLSGGEYYIHTETMGRSLMEAVCCRVPVVATDVGGVGELFDENENIGCLLEKNNSIGNGVEESLKLFKNTANIVEYDWDILFNKYFNMFYNFLFGNSVKIYCFDIDGTIINDPAEEQKIAKEIKVLKKKDVLILNSARSISQETLEFAKNCGAKYLILENGRYLFYEKNGDYKINKRWSSYEKGFNVPDCIKDMYNYIKINTENSNVKSNFLNSISISNVKAPDVSRLQKMICQNNSDLSLLTFKDNCKIVSRYINKKTALEFVLKDEFSASVLICAGNSLADVGYIGLADVKVAHINISEYFEGKKGQTIAFNDTELKTDLIQRIMENE